VDRAKIQFKKTDLGDEQKMFRAGIGRDQEGWTGLARNEKEKA
jgi:hypothetical protein